MHPRAQSLIDALDDRSARVGIVGLGYAGLPLAMAFAEAGFPVVGVDVSEAKVAALTRRESYLAHISDARLAGALGASFLATTDYAELATARAIVICVPTPLSKTRTPDLSYVVAATEAIAAVLTSGQLVVLQSTTYPGTTEDLLLPSLSEAIGGAVGEDFFLGYAPDRVDPGNTEFAARDIPKVVSGVTEDCCALTDALFSTIVDVTVPVSSTTTAETTKLHENTFRQVNIAIANELALMCDRLGIDAWEVIHAAATKPYAFLPHFPGPGIGGDCIPIVPHFLAWRLREFGYSARLIETAHQINAYMPAHVLQKVVAGLNTVGKSVRGSRILVAGVAYKPGVNDTRESPALEILQQLAARGADVRYADPLVPHVTVNQHTWHAVPWTLDEVKAADAVVLVTHHAQFLQGEWWSHCDVVVDTRHVVPAGPNVYGI